VVDGTTVVDVVDVLLEVVRGTVVVARVVIGTVAAVVVDRVVTGTGAAAGDEPEHDATRNAQHTMLEVAAANR
jgi:hypothetical protein